MKFEQFVTLLTNSRIVREPEVAKVAAAFQQGCRDSGTEITVESFCDFLLSTDRLTEYQCSKLRMGKWKGFYLDDYLLLGQVGNGSDYSSYAARDTRDGTIVCLVVTPIALCKSGRTEYRVEPYSDS